MPVDLNDAFSFDQSLPTDFSAGEIQDERRTEVAILGAGLAGLTCAFRLSKGSRRPLSQDEVMVLEREDQTGGRIRSLRVGDDIINLGAVTFQPHHYPRYMALLSELGLTGRVQIIARNQMIFGYGSQDTRADYPSLVADSLKGAFGRGVFTPGEGWHLFRFLRFLRHVTAPENEDQFMALHQISVAQWARQFGFDDDLQRKFVEPFTRYCFRAPDEVSAAFGVFLLGFNFSQPATLVGGFGQIADVMAERLEGLIENGATALAVSRQPRGFMIIYRQGGRLHRLHARFLVVALPANVAAELVAEMRPQASQVAYGSGAAVVAVGKLKREAALQLRVSVGSSGTVIYGGEIKARLDGDHIANVLAYRGDASQELSKLFEDGQMQKLVDYDIRPASAAPKPGQKPLPVDWGDGLYMAGDCAGLFPSQETAVSTGEQAAELLREVVSYG